MTPNGNPALREGTPATWNKTMYIHRVWPLGLTEVNSPAGNKESTASFWQANFSGPWTWVNPLLSPYPNFFTLSGRERVGVIMAQNIYVFYFHPPHPAPLPPQAERGSFR